LFDEDNPEVESMSHHSVKSVTEALKDAAKAVGKKASSVVGSAGDALAALEKEAEVGPALHEQVLGVLAEMKQKDPSIEEVLRRAHGYAVLPDVGKANLVLGGAYGIGEVFEKHRVVGYAAVVQFTLGVQIGGETFDELIVFHDANVFEHFKAGKFAFAANAAIGLVKATAEAAHGFGEGTSLYVRSEGGLQLVTSIGIQKFIFRPAALGRARTADRHTGAAEVKAQDAGEAKSSETEKKSSETEKTTSPNSRMS